MGRPTDVLVLCYHGVSPTWPAVTSVDPERLEWQLRCLVRQGYRGATLSEALTVPPGARTLAVTFDDAHRSVLDLAHPIMADLGLVGTVFAPTDFVSTGRAMDWEGIARWLGGPHEHELACMSWDELDELAGAGWEIGSHTCSHPHLTRIGDAELDSELRGSRAVLEERLGRACTSLAYPYGDHDGRVVRAAVAAGYALATTVPPAHASPLPMMWPRVDVSHGDRPVRFRVRCSPVMRRMSRSPGWRPVIAATRAATRPPRRAIRALRRS